ncbi:unnamed protein product [Bemisia tabaci]|uniref:Juvenile hormone acid methyltransferase n=1 Tax=Bemisia tabaci TaxID=7038 RepID=A0A9P0ABW6_BEMTA|nr:unnamed protein product [Bemisia tabaci]
MITTRREFSATKRRTLHLLSHAQSDCAFQPSAHALGLDRRQWVTGFIHSSRDRQTMRITTDLLLITNVRLREKETDNLVSRTRQSAEVDSNSSLKQSSVGVLTFEMLEGNLYLDFNQSNPNNFKDSEDLLADHKSLFRWFSEEVVLDVGCGPGDVTRHVLYPWLPENANKTVLGVDVSPVMKDLGNKKFGHPDVFFETFDISSKNLAVITEDEKFRDGFTKIFSFHVFHWIDDLEGLYIQRFGWDTQNQCNKCLDLKLRLELVNDTFGDPHKTNDRLAFENVYKLLRPGGQVLLTFPVSRQYQRLYKQMQEREPWSKILKGVHREIPNYFLNGDPITEFLSIVTKVGFKVVSCKLITTHDEFPSIDALKKLVGSLDVHFNKIPTNLRGQYLEECIEIMRQKNLKQLDDGTAVVTEKRITAFLEK